MSRKTKKNKPNPWKDVLNTPSYHEDEKGRIHVHRFNTQVGSKFITTSPWGGTLNGQQKAYNNRKETKVRRRAGILSRICSRLFKIQRIPEQITGTARIDGKPAIVKVKTNSMRKIQHTRPND